ncbi:peptidase M61 [Mesonia ostreae]|uniref:Peptidase M61 n=1 Tax=Mesonia ostreae TaxID=861110 RepID=A0ABU2KLG9_9FLAO|nr:peptidase M61 [Mesonia ostreae]MDT0295571.1 peptidase M61 [Mesonia ostreae]
MKKMIYTAALAFALFSCKSTAVKTAENDTIVTNIDLVDIQDDKVMVSVDPGKIDKETIVFYIPKTVPGTYSTDNYGKFIENLKAYNYKGEELNVTNLDENSWQITDATQLDKVTYWVNDSFDVEGEEGVFSPAGTNIAANENFMLNLHAFVGYFDGLTETPYQLLVKRPNELMAGTSLKSQPASQPEGDATIDEYAASRYFEITDNPIMYSASESVDFQLGDMKVILDVYSPNGVHTAESIKPNMSKILEAQKRFLGDIDNTDMYAILLYLADMQKTDAKGFGALEHHTSTTVVLPETMPLQALNESMKDVVSHEFFHIITPLSVHSDEVHYFDYNNPKMSQHLWMYEGVTEYFANLFQVNQGLINDEAFYARMAEKIASSRSFDDTMSFTELSENILDDKYEPSYYNVYQKGALIGMALDIRLRELSDGEMGILDLMKKLSAQYGKENPFKDDELFDDIVKLTYPEIRTFLTTYVSGTTPIPYQDFFAKVGVEKTEQEVKSGYFLNGQVPFIDGSPETKAIFVRKGIELNSFLKEMNLKGGDIIKSINGTEYTIDNAYALIMTSQGWKKGDKIEMVIDRDGEEMTLKGKVSPATLMKTSYKSLDLPATDARVQLREAWLRG